MGVDVSEENMQQKLELYISFAGNNTSVVKLTICLQNDLKEIIFLKE